MPRNTQCVSLVRGRSMRITKVDSCGRPISDAESVVVSKGYTSVAYSANTDEGEEINVKNAAGETCVREPGTPTLLGYGVEINFCQVDPDAYAILTGQRTVVDDSGNVVGFTADTAISAGDVHFALEVWAGAPGGNACDNPGATASYGYFLLPLVQGGVVGDFEIANAEITFTVTGAATLDGNRWGRGLHQAVLDSGGNPSLLAEPLTKTEHFLFLTTGLKPPAAQCGARPYLDPSDPALVSPTASATDLTVTFSAQPTGTEPFWVDFGDGTWDYSADGSDLVHTYDEAGDYDYVFYRGGSNVPGQVTATAP